MYRYGHRSDHLPLWMYGIILILALGFMSLGTFIPESRAVEALDKAGYENIQILDQHIFFVQIQGCGRSDSVKFDARAINPAGEEVELFVCSGLIFKGSTIRY